jgi:hypothetical protein
MNYSRMRIGRKERIESFLKLTDDISIYYLKLHSMAETLVGNHTYCRVTHQAQCQPSRE